LTRATFLKALSAVAFAALLVCALDALSGTAIADGGAPPGPGGDFQGAPPAPPPSTDAAVAAPPAAAGAPPDGGARSSADRRRASRRFRRFGPHADGGVPDGGVADAAPMRIAARDAGIPPRFVPPVITPPVAAPPPMPVMPSKPSTSQPVTELGFNTCQKVPAGKRVVKVNLKPDVELPELVAWISSITCKSYVLPGHVSSSGRKLTFVTQGLMTRDEAYASFLSALDSVGLTLEKGPGYDTIIETSKAKSSGVPVYGFDGKPAKTPSRRAKD
jgi:hypothetical protein